MSNVIHTRLIKVGNSQGVRIPKVVLEQLQLTDTIELEIQGNQLIIRPGARPRAGWAEQFQRMAANGDDTLLDDDSALTSWEETEWEW
jgi:antitoxin MazE